MSEKLKKSRTGSCTKSRGTRKSSRRSSSSKKRHKKSLRDSEPKLTPKQKKEQREQERELADLLESLSKAEHQIEEHRRMFISSSENPKLSIQAVFNEIKEQPEDTHFDKYDLKKFLEKNQINCSVKEFEILFRSIDKDGGGSVKLETFTKNFFGQNTDTFVLNNCKSFGCLLPNLKAQDLGHFLDLVRIELKGIKKFENLKDKMLLKINEFEHEQFIARLFNLIDTTGRGVVYLRDVYKLMKKYIKGATYTSASRAIRRLDLGGDGILDLDEFKMAFLLKDLRDFLNSKKSSKLFFQKSSSIIESDLQKKANTERRNRMWNKGPSLGVIKPKQSPATKKPFSSHKKRRERNKEASIVRKDSSSKLVSAGKKGHQNGQRRVYKRGSSIDKIATKRRFVEDVVGDLKECSAATMKEIRRGMNPVDASPRGCSPVEDQTYKASTRESYKGKVIGKIRKKKKIHRKGSTTRTRVVDQRRRSSKNALLPQLSSKKLLHPNANFTKKASEYSSKNRSNNKKCTTLSFNFTRSQSNFKSSEKSNSKIMVPLLFEPEAREIAPSSYRLIDTRDSRADCASFKEDKETEMIPKKENNKYFLTIAPAPRAAEQTRPHPESPPHQKPLKAMEPCFVDLDFYEDSDGRVLHRERTSPRSRLDYRSIKLARLRERQLNRSSNTKKNSSNKHPSVFSNTRREKAPDSGEQNQQSTVERCFKEQPVSNLDSFTVNTKTNRSLSANQILNPKRTDRSLENSKKKFKEFLKTVDLVTTYSIGNDMDLTCLEAGKLNPAPNTQRYAPNSARKAQDYDEEPLTMTKRRGKDSTILRRSKSMEESKDMTSYRIGLKTEQSEVLLRTRDYMKKTVSRQSFKLLWSMFTKYRYMNNLKLELSTRMDFAPKAVFNSIRNTKKKSLTTDDLFLHIGKELDITDVSYKDCQLLFERQVGSQKMNFSKFNRIFSPYSMDKAFQLNKEAMASTKRNGNHHSIEASLTSSRSPARSLKTVFSKKTLELWNGLVRTVFKHQRSMEYFQEKLKYRLHEFFKMMDFDRNDLVTCSDLINLFEQESLLFEIEDVYGFLSQFDETNSGTVSYLEFERFILQRKPRGGGDGKVGGRKKLGRGWSRSRSRSQNLKFPSDEMKEEFTKYTESVMRGASIDTDNYGQDENAASDNLGQILVNNPNKTQKIRMRTSGSGSKGYKSPREVKTTRNQKSRGKRRIGVKRGRHRGSSSRENRYRDSNVFHAEQEPEVGFLDLDYIDTKNTTTREKYSNTKRPKQSRLNREKSRSRKRLQAAVAATKTKRRTKKHQKSRKRLRESTEENLIEDSNLERKSMAYRIVEQMRTGTSTIDDREKHHSAVYHPNKYIQVRGRFLINKRPSKQINKHERQKGTFVLDQGRELNLSKYEFKADGPGVITTSIGDVIHGKWLNGKLEGVVTINHKGYEPIKIHFEGGLMNDFGLKLFQTANEDGSFTILTKNGEKYVGGCYEMLRHGQGVLYYPNNCVQYQGGWIADNRHGKGVEYSEKGFKNYEGGFKEDRRSGWGKEFDSFGRMVYEGEFLNDCRHGYGTLYEFAEDGGMIKFVGEFKNGAKNGRGCVKAEGDEMIHGQWEDGEMIITTTISM